MERLVHIDALRGGASILLIVHVVALPLLTEPGSSPAIDLWLVATLWLLFGCGFLVPAALHVAMTDAASPSGACCACCRCICWRSS